MKYDSARRRVLFKYPSRRNKTLSSKNDHVTTLEEASQLSTAVVYSSAASGETTTGQATPYLVSLETTPSNDAACTERWCHGYGYNRCQYPVRGLPEDTVNNPNADIKKEIRGNCVKRFS